MAETYVAPSGATREKQGRILGVSRNHNDNATKGVSWDDHQQPTTTKGNHSKMNAVLNTPQTERITLYYREGSSDKVYQVSIESQGEGFVVNFACGRRGSTMSTGTKTQAPVDHETAARILRNWSTKRRPRVTPRDLMAHRIKTPLRKIVSPASCLNCSIRSTSRKSNACSKIRPGVRRRSSMAAGCWSVRLVLKSTASIARAC